MLDLSYSGTKIYAACTGISGGYSKACGLTAGTSNIWCRQLSTGVCCQRPSSAANMPHVPAAAD